MIRYRRLYESEDSDVKLYDVVSCGGYNWYVIDIEGGIVTLLPYEHYFGEAIFDNDNSNIYKTSEIRKYLKMDALPWLENKGIHPIPTNLPDVGCTDKIWLLSADEARSLPQRILQNGAWWYLRSPAKCPGTKSNCASTVNIDGKVSLVGTPVHMKAHSSVRPAIRVRVEDLD